MIGELPPHLSISGAGTWETCARKWHAHYVLRTGISEAGPEADIGVMAHEVMERLGVLPASMRTVELASHIAKIQWAGRPLAHRRQAMGHVVRALRNLEVALGDTVMVERDLLVPLGDVPAFKGFLDRADLLDDGSLRILDYKGLALDTPIPTPTGWTTMGAVEVGDEVFGADGRPCSVTVKSGVHDRPCYRVRFDDASSIVCDNVHLWEIQSSQVGPLGAVATEALPGMLYRKGQRHLTIPNAHPLALPDRDLPIDPYVLGAWLGDGDTRGHGLIHKPLPALFDEIERRGFATTTYAWGETSGTRRVHGLGALLKATGLAGHKHIPDTYLRASSSQRWDLLRGLMDTDGSYNRARRRYVYGATTDKGLALQVAELVVSLGLKVNVSSVQARGFGLTVTAWRPEFTSGAVPFIAKADGYQGWELPTTASTVSTRRLIVEVEEVPSVPTACIAVDSDDHLYLCGEQMVPTHNTGKRPGRRDWLAEKGLQLAAYAAAVEVLDERPVSEGALVWTASGRVDDFTMSDTAKANAVRWLSRIWRDIEAAAEADDFPANPGPLCSWCVLVAECPEGRDATLARAEDRSKSIGAYGQAMLDEIAVQSMADTLAVVEGSHLSVVPDDEVA